MFKLGDKFKDNGKGYPSHNTGKIMTVEKIKERDEIYFHWYDNEEDTTWIYIESEMEKVDA